MVSEAPPFWWERPDWRAAALYPVSALYGWAAERRLESARREKLDVPVLCVGNLTVGGAGKTPVAIGLAEAATAAGHKPGFLSRGHGGSSRRPHLVDAGHDSAKHVGDEPLLLAAAAPTAVTPKRPAGAKLLIEAGCDFLIMDDGFQSAHLHFDYALLVVDSFRGVGNGHVIPGGPMRAPLLAQLRYADAVLKMGDGAEADNVIRMAARAGKPILEAHALPRNGERLDGRRFLAFAGIGTPQKFFHTVARAGGAVVQPRAFKDHHPYTDEELLDLSAAAQSDNLELITTAKDAARLRHGTAAAQDLLQRLSVLEIEVRFEPESVARRIVAETAASYRQRQLGL